MWAARLVSGRRTTIDPNEITRVFEMHGEHVVQGDRVDQEDVIAFLSDPASYGCGVERVELIETHISKIFLTGERVYKLKRAVKYPYLDFSTEEQRRRACDAELALNHRTAPDLYLEVRGIGRAKDGTIGWGERETILDWVVVMRRFDQELLFDALARRGFLSARLIHQLVDHAVAFHGTAKQRPDHGGAVAVAQIERSNVDCLCRAGSRFFAPEEIVELHARSLEVLARVSALLDARRAAGKVRHCHGDLHLRNICVLDGKPVLFDCLEFAEELATIDVLYDFAFLLMDLEHRSLNDLANIAANRYFDLTEDDEGLAALPLFLSLRAAIRAHVTATAANCYTSPDDLAREIAEARLYLDLARTVLCPQPCRLIAIGGLSGAGKSTIASKLAPLLGTRPGARVLRSDVIRKRRCGVMPEVALPSSAYGSDTSQGVYETICSKAAVALQARYTVIIDAVALHEEERRSFAAVAEEARVPFLGIWLDAPAETMASRLRSRRNDASDATPEILQLQRRRDPGRIDWQRIDVGGHLDVSFDAVRRVLGSA
jgi:aminoglycoside phosphotransferase family enzyme/predicted kinase